MSPTTRPGFAPSAMIRSDIRTASLMAVRHQQGRLAQRVGHLRDLDVQVFALELVQRRERLVHQHHAGIERQRPRQRDPLLHAAGELPRVHRRHVRQAHELEKLRHPGLALLGPAAGDDERKLDVPADVEPRHQDRLLQHEPDVVPALARWLAADADVAGVMTHQPRDDLEQRGLAAAGRPDEGDELSRLDLQVDVAQDGQRPGRRPVRLVHPAERDPLAPRRVGVGRRHVIPPGSSAPSRRRPTARTGTGGRTVPRTPPRRRRRWRCRGAARRTWRPPGRRCG